MRILLFRRPSRKAVIFVRRTLTFLVVLALVTSSFYTGTFSPIAPSPPVPKAHAAAFLEQLGTTTISSSAITLTLGAGVSAAAGNTVVLLSSANGQNKIATSASDSKGNTYTIDATVSGGVSGDYVNASVASAYLAAGLSAGDTITLNYASSQDLTLIALEFSGVVSSGRVDKIQTNPDTASESAINTGATAAQTASHNLVVAAIAHSAAATTLTDTTTNMTATSTVTNGRTLFGRWKMLSEDSSGQSYVGTLGANKYHCELIVTYKSSSFTLDNDGDGGTDDTTVTTGNSGGASGNAWDNVTIGAGSAVIFDNAQSHSGGMAYKLTVPATPAVTYLKWGTSMNTPSTVFGRFYIYRTGNPSAAATVADFNTTSGTGSGQIIVGTGGTINCKAAGANATSTNTLTLNAWNRIEFKFSLIGATVNVTCELFTGANVDGTTPTETVTNSPAATATSFNDIRFGYGNSANLPASESMWMDDMVLNNTGYPGPAPTLPTVTSPTATSISSTSATLGANVTAGTGITARGTCWGTSAAPTGNCVAEGGTTTGVFTHARTGLSANTLIYYRGYATNSVGTGYSTDGTFTTTGFTQSTYRLFTNSNGTDVGSALAAQNTAASLNADGDQFRLRALVHVANQNVSSSGKTFKLQFVGKGTGTCASPTGGTPATYTDVTTSTSIAYYNNATPADGAALTANASDPTHGGDTIVNQSYEEANNFTNAQGAINAGQDGKWDFSLYGNTAAAATTFCFRIVESDATALSTYTVYPEITTQGAPSASSYSDTPDPVQVGSDITFSLNWADANQTMGEQVKVHFCKTNAITPSGTGGSCPGGTWGSSSALTTSDPAEVTYTVLSGDAPTITYYAFVCDDGSLCSGTTGNSGTTTVNRAPTIISSSALFDGTGDLLTVPDHADFDFGSGDFTIDTWLRLNATGTYQDFVTKRANSSVYTPFMLRVDNTNKLTFQGSKNNTAWDIVMTGTTNLTTGTWYHVAVTRSGDSYRLFLNGSTEAIAIVSGALMTNTSSVAIGASTTDGSIQLLNGWLDEVRISKGIARWTANFTPPTSAYTTDSSTKLLLHAEGADGSTTFTDDSGAGRTVTAGGNAQIDTAQAKFGGVLDSPDPVTAGNNITFSITWSEADGNQVKVHACKTNAITPSGTGGSCPGGTWASSSALTSTTPKSEVYATVGGDVGAQNYYAFVCDNQSACSSGTAGTFTVNAALGPPTVTSPTQSGVTDSSATLGANVTSDGGAAITARGTCWGTSANPTTNCLAEGGTTTGVFTHQRTGLPASTLIYYRGYATNSQGTGYSADDSFTTSAVSPVITAFGKTFSAQSNIIFSTEGQISLASGVSSGTLDSLTFDTQTPNGVVFQNIWWNGTFNGFVGFQLATAAASGGPWTYYGPDCSTTNFYSMSAADQQIKITCASQQNKRYFRYKAKICYNAACTTTSGTSPVVTDIAVNWSR